MGSKQVALSARPYQLLSRTSPSRAANIFLASP
jgi:hypothetical protein